MSPHPDMDKIFFWHDCFFEGQNFTQKQRDSRQNVNCNPSKKQSFKGYFWGYISRIKKTHALIRIGHIGLFNLVFFKLLPNPQFWFYKKKYAPKNKSQLTTDWHRPQPSWHDRRLQRSQVYPGLRNDPDSGMFDTHMERHALLTKMNFYQKGDTPICNFHFHIIDWKPISSG